MTPHVYDILFIWWFGSENEVLLLRLLTYFKGFGIQFFRPTVNKTKCYDICFVPVGWDNMVKEIKTIKILKKVKIIDNFKSI